MLPCISQLVSRMIPNLSGPWGFDLFHDDTDNKWKVQRAEGTKQYYDSIEKEFNNNSNISVYDKNRLQHHLVFVSNGGPFDILGDHPLPFVEIKLGSHTFSLVEILALGSKPSDEKSSSKPSADEPTSSSSSKPSADESTSSSSSTPPANKDISEDFKKMDFSSDK